MSNGRQDFQGWYLGGWSLQHELLELRFEFRPLLEKSAQIESDNDRCYRGKSIFSRPTRLAFVRFEPGARVEQVEIATDGHEVVHRFALAQGAFVEVRAKACASIEW